MEFIQAAQHGPADNYPIMRVVMHGSVTRLVPGAALSLANYFADLSDRYASTQYVVDADTAIQCVKDSVIAYGAPPNKGSIHIELCDIQGGSPTRWQDALHQSMLKRAAVLVASICLKYDLPIRKLSASDLLAGRKGICGHADVSSAWHQTDHIDPGSDFPWAQFISLVQQAATPTPAPKPSKGEPMFLVSLKSSPAQYVSNGQTRRWVPAVGYRDFLIAVGCDPVVHEFDTISGLEAVAGPLVPGTPDYTPGA